MLKKLYQLLLTLNFHNMDKSNRENVIKHNIISAILGLLAAIPAVLLILTKPQPAVRHGLLAILIFMVLVVSIHGIYTFMTHKTYWTARIKEHQTAKQSSEKGRAELIAFAENLRKNK